MCTCAPLLARPASQVARTGGIAMRRETFLRPCDAALAVQHEGVNATHVIHHHALHPGTTLPRAPAAAAGGLPGGRNGAALALAAAAAAAARMAAHPPPLPPLLEMYDADGEEWGLNSSAGPEPGSVYNVEAVPGVWDGAGGRGGKGPPSRPAFGLPTGLRFSVLPEYSQFGLPTGLVANYQRQYCTAYCRPR